MFTDQVAIITGGGRGIGRATAEMLVAGGARVVLGDLDADVLADAAAAIGGDVVTKAGNLTADGVPEALVDTAIASFGRVDIIVNNAGYTLDAPIHKLCDDDFQAMLDIHAIAPFRLLRAAAPHLRDPAKRERADGREVFRKVVNVSSIAGTMGNAGQVNYASAKSGVVGLTKTLAKEWGPLKINVNAVAFGFVETRLTASRTDDSVIEVDGRRVAVGVPEATRSLLSGLVPLGRPGTTVEAAGGIAFLCSPWSDYVTGQVLNVTGGATLGMGS